MNKGPNNRTFVQAGSHQHREWIDKMAVAYHQSKYKPGLRYSLTWTWFKRRCGDCRQVRYVWKQLRLSVARRDGRGHWVVRSRPIKLQVGVAAPPVPEAPWIGCRCNGVRGPRQMQVFGSERVIYTAQYWDRYSGNGLGGPSSSQSGAIEGGGSGG